MPNQTVLQNIVMIGVESLGPGFDVYSVGKNPVYILHMVRVEGKVLPSEAAIRANIEGAGNGARGKKNQDT
jgi:hypothetical protein